jgi:hypothetical protein
MGNGLIARQVQSAGQVLRGLNGFFFHDEDFSTLTIFVSRSANSRQNYRVFLYFLCRPWILYSRPVFREARPVPRAEM